MTITTSMTPRVAGSALLALCALVPAGCLAPESDDETGGDTDAAAYREFMNDVWKSQDGGVTWAVVTLHAPWRGRGGHSLIYFLGDLYLFNGQGGAMGQHPDAQVRRLGIYIYT